MTQAFQPTDEQRRTVKAMAGFGIPHEGIAILLEIDPKTLRKYFQADLDRGSVEATAKVAQTLFHMATVDKNVGAAIFWMKARAGWREKHEVQVTANPITLMSDEKLERAIEQGFTQWQEVRGNRVIEGRAEPDEQDAETPACSTPTDDR